MKVTKYEQSGFIIESDKGVKLAIDIGSKTPIEKLTGLSVDVFLVSHIHADHFAIENIKALNPQKIFLNQECISSLSENLTNVERIESDKEYEGLDFKIKTFSVDHGPSAPTLKENLGFLIEVDNQKVYFAGDMYSPSGIDVKDLIVDFVLIPVGGYYTFGPQEAYNFIKTFKKIGKVISMHYERNDNIDPIRHSEFIKLASSEFEVE